MKKGLVLEGGALRGLFSAGVMDVMMDHGITYDGIVGVSAGAAFGCNYISNQKGRALRYNKLMAKEWRYCSIRSWLTTGDLFGAEFAYHVVPTKYDIFDNEAFEANPTAFYVVCTDVETGKAVYHRCDKGGHKFFDWVRASASMPMVSRVVELDGYKLLDGGVADSIPLKFFEREGYNMVRALAERHIMYNAQLDDVAHSEAAGTAYVIRPDAPLPIGHTSHDPKEMQTVYDEGRRKGESVIKEIKEFLDGQPPFSAILSHHS